MREIHSEDELAAVLASGVALRGLRIQGVDLTHFERALSGRDDLSGTVVLGGTLSPRLERHLRRHHVLVFPTDPTCPVDPYRARLYEPGELYAGLESGGYEATPDARAYRWAIDAKVARDTFVTMMRAIHDDAMSDALDEALDGLPVVGVMGGHHLQRGSATYAAAAHLGHRLAEAGLLVLTGGGPGAMEAANLGAFAPSAGHVRAALDAVSTVPSFDPDVGAWAAVALRARSALLAGHRRGSVPRSIGIPTWYYGHEPPNVFCDGIAKYFSNALREDGLLARATTGIVVLPGAAGTVQEIFQTGTRLYYTKAPRPAPLILVGVQHWTHRVPLWPALEALAHERAMASAIHLVDGVDAALDIIVASSDAPGAG